MWTWFCSSSLLGSTIRALQSDTLIFGHRNQCWMRLLSGRMYLSFHPIARYLLLFCIRCTRCSFPFDIHTLMDQCRWFAHRQHKYCHDKEQHPGLASKLSKGSPTWEVFCLYLEYGRLHSQWRDICGWFLTDSYEFHRRLHWGKVISNAYFLLKYSDCTRLDAQCYRPVSKLIKSPYRGER